MVLAWQLLAGVAILFGTFFIGRRIGESVPDEVVPADAYLSFAVDLLAFATLGLVGYWLAGPVWGLALPILAGALRMGTQAWVSAPLLGIAIAALPTLEIPQARMLLLIVLVANFIHGARLKSPYLSWALQPLVGLMGGIVLLIA